MTPNQQLDAAIVLASTKFSGIFDKGEMPYILHCLKVSHYLKTDDLELMSIAVLHDIIEDTDVTYQQLKDMGFSERVINGIRCMTKTPGETNREYLDKIKSNPDAIKVKLCDLRHNSDIRRLKGITEKDVKRMQKYHEMFMELKDLV